MTTTRARSTSSGQAKATKKTNLKRTTIFLTEEDREALRRIAFEKKTSMANLIREAVLDVIDLDEDEKEAMKAVEESDEGSMTLEDYMKEREKRERKL